MAREDQIYEVLAQLWGQPCNYGSDDGTIDQYMLEHAEEWCEDACGHVPASVCWAKFIELKLAENEVSSSNEEQASGYCPNCGRMPNNHGKTCRYCKAKLDIEEA